VKLFFGFAAVVLFLAGCAGEKPQAKASETVPPLFVHFFTFENSLQPVSTAPVKLSRPFTAGRLTGIVERRWNRVKIPTSSTSTDNPLQQTTGNRMFRRSTWASR
jgi:hypothetical protein